MTSTLDLDRLIHLFKLEPLPDEGGLFRQTWMSPYQASLPGEDAVRPQGTAIFYLLTDQPDSFSAMHRLPVDEVWHFYLGDPLEMTLLYPDGHSTQVLLGQDVFAGQQPQWIVPAGVWQGTRLAASGRFALAGTTMAPGFIPSDLELGTRDALLEQYPQARRQILALTRPVK